jgi:hypothetical protein
MGTAAAQAAPPGASREVWQGSYDCAQGVTGLTLTLEVGPGAQVQALFDFYPIAANPAVAHGCFAMSGVLDAGGHLALAPGAWLSQPPGYVTVGLVGVLSGNGLRGAVAGPGCGGFLLSRAAPEAQQDIPSACLGVVS